MSNFPIRLKFLRTKKGLTQAELAKILDIGKSTISMYEVGAREPDFETLEGLADFFNVDMNYLLGRDKGMENEDADNIVQIRFLGNVAASFNHMAIEEYETMEIPRSWIGRSSPDNYFAMRVVGSSMYPEYRDGDEVLCEKCDDMGRSGCVGVFICPDGEGTLKRINYVQGEDWVELEPINPEYEPKVIKGYELEQCRVIGRAVRLIRDITGN